MLQRRVGEEKKREVFRGRTRGNIRAGAGKTCLGGGKKEEKKEHTEKCSPIPRSVFMTLDLLQFRI